MEEKKNYIGTTVTDKEKRYIEQAAKKSGHSVAEYIRYCLKKTISQPSGGNERELMSVSSAARLMSTTASTVRSLIHEGQLEYTRIKGYYRVYRDDVENYIKVNHVKASDSTIDEGYYTTREAADILGVTPNTVTKWIKEGKLSASKPGRDYRISKKALKSVIRT